MKKRLALVLLGGLLGLGCGRDQASNQDRRGAPAPGPGSTGHKVGSGGGAPRSAPDAPTPTGTRAQNPGNTASGGSGQAPRAAGGTH